jgi:hypothetical protein
MFAPQPRQRELGYWLSEEAGRFAPAGVTTALRAMAWNRSQQRGLAGAALGTGVSLAGSGLLAVVSGGGPGLLAGLSGPGIALVLVGALMFRRIRQRRVPRVVEAAASRAPSKFSSGIGLGAFFAVVFAVVLYPLAGLLLDRGPVGGILLAGYATLFLLLIGSIFTLPSYFMEHARRDFRADIAASPELRQALEQMSLTWQDPVGSREFGPL